MSQIIKFSTNDELAFASFHPVPANKLVPDWYKELNLFLGEVKSFNAKAFIENNNSTLFTIKGCVPVKDYIRSGYIIRAHTDVLITPDCQNEQHGWWWKSNSGCLESHAFNQCPIDLGKGKNVYIKFINPWFVKTPPGYSCLFYQPEYFFNEKLRLFPAIVDTDTYDSAVNFPGVVLSDKTFMIKCGDPVMAVFPFKRDDWSSEISFAEKQNLTKIKLYLARAYSKLFHKRKNYT